MTMKISHLFIFALTLSLASCKKEQINDRVILLSKSWKMTAYKIVSPVAGTPLEGYSTDLFNANGCLENQIWNYSGNGGLQINEAPNCITPNSKSSVTGSWILSPDGNKIDISIEWFGQFSYTIVTLDQGLLRVNRKQTMGFGSSAGNPAPSPVEVEIQYDYEPK